MTTYEQVRDSVRRESKTEAWVRSKDVSEIVSRIHELEDQINKLEDINAGLTAAAASLYEENLSMMSYGVLSNPEHEA